MARLGIGEKRMGRPVEQMSRGMQQKVAIARAILTSPTLLLLDEPTTGLDPRSKLDVQTFIEELQADHDATIVLTTHDLAEADRLCGRIGILAGGRLTAEDTPERLKDGSPVRARAPADARKRVHEVHRPLPRRRRRGGRAEPADPARWNSCSAKPTTECARTNNTRKGNFVCIRTTRLESYTRTPARDRAPLSLRSKTRARSGAAPSETASVIGLIQVGSMLVADGPDSWPPALSGRAPGGHAHRRPTP
jgi:ABC-type multidrug transport system ATPase subunit